MLWPYVLFSECMFIIFGHEEILFIHNDKVIISIAACRGILCPQQGADDSPSSQAEGGSNHYGIQNLRPPWCLAGAGITV